MMRWKWLAMVVCGLAITGTGYGVLLIRRGFRGRKGYGTERLDRQSHRLRSNVKVVSNELKAAYSFFPRTSNFLDSSRFSVVLHD